MKVARPVLRGAGRSNAPGLPGMGFLQATSSWAGWSSGRSTSLPLLNVAPARTSGTRWGALTARQRCSADSMSLNAIAMPAAREPGPLVTRCRSRTVAKVDPDRVGRPECSGEGGWHVEAEHRERLGQALTQAAGRTGVGAAELGDQSGEHRFGPERGAGVVGAAHLALDGGPHLLGQMVLDVANLVQLTPSDHRMVEASRTAEASAFAPSRTARIGLVTSRPRSRRPTNSERPQPMMALSTESISATISGIPMMN